MKIILNNLGVIIDGDYGNEVVNQSNHNINTLQFAIDDPDYQANYANYLATASFTFQGGEKEVTDILMGSTRFEFKGKAYNGYSMKLTRNLTGYAGDMSITFRLKNAGQQIVLASQPMQKMVTLTAGATVYAPNITQEQYNQLLEQVGLKIPFTEKGQPEGVATLDESGKIPLDQIPSLVDSVLLINEKVIYPSYEELPFGNMNHKYAYLYLSSTTVGRPPRTQYRLSYVKSEDGEWKKNEGGSIFYKLIVCNEVESTTEPRYRIFKTNIDYSFAPSVDWDRWVKDVGVRVGNNKGDAYDSCKGQHLERQIFADRFPYTAVSGLNEETGEITYMFNPNVVDRFDASELEETGYLKVWLKDGDNPNGGNQ